jgi:hypothetical protein
LTPSFDVGSTRPCEQCGKPMPIARRGGQRKRFCGPTCRHRHWAATQPGGTGRAAAPVASVEVRVGAAARIATLEKLYDRLRADVEQYGTLIETPTGLKANPSVGELRRVIADLGRLAPFEEEPAEEIASLHAI